jgi:hypothetical protein
MTVMGVVLVCGTIRGGTYVYAAGQHEVFSKREMTGRRRGICLLC